jgi:hypothetical protein
MKETSAKQIDEALAAGWEVYGVRVRIFES